MDSLPSKSMLLALRPVLSGWMGPDAAADWLAVAGTLPACSRLFLEIHPASATPRCDLVIAVLASDGSLSGWLDGVADRGRSAAWQKTAALLERWRRQLQDRAGALRTLCFMMWLEFDVCADQKDLGDPSVFIGLTPAADVAELAGDLADYPDFQAALRSFDDAIRKETRLHVEVVRTNALTLGHVGYMAARQAESRVLPLRSCWRCDDLEHFHALLSLARVDHDRGALSERLRWMEDLKGCINSVMLHLDGNDRFLSDFSLEVNVFDPYADRLTDREEAVLGALLDRGLVSEQQLPRLRRFSGRYTVQDGRAFYCALHHFKLKIIRSTIVEAKVYWLLRPVRGGGVAEAGSPSADGAAARPLNTR